METQMQAVLENLRWQRDCALERFEDLKRQIERLETLIAEMESA